MLCRLVSCLDCLVLRRCTWKPLTQYLLYRVSLSTLGPNTLRLLERITSMLLKRLRAITFRVAGFVLKTVNGLEQMGAIKNKRQLRIWGVGGFLFSSTLISTHTLLIAISMTRIVEGFALIRCSWILRWIASESCTLKRTFIELNSLWNSNLIRRCGLGTTADRWIAQEKFADYEFQIPSFLQNIS